jgi:intracellular multiplication protein IcmP
MPPPKGAQGQGQGGGDNSLMPFWVMLTTAGAGYGIWYKAHALIVAAVFHLQLFQIDIISVFFSVPVLDSWANYMRTVPADKVDWNHLVGACYAVGHYMRYPFGALLLGMAAWVYTKNVGLKFRRTYSMKTLRDQEQNNWPQIMPVISRDLTSEDVRLGPWAMSMTPMEFAKQFNLLKRDEFAPRGFSHLAAPLTATVKKGEARRIFTLQLGPYWNGFESLPPQTKALAAIFLAKINRDRDGAAKLLKILSESAAKGHLDVTTVPALLNKHMNSELVQEIVQKHAYVMTVMAALLVGARQDGVLASADFLWLKPIDRRLWYVLNTVGRQTAFVEVGGVIAHWQVEKALNQKCLMPMVEEAVKALELAIKEVKMSPKDWGALSS